MSDSQINTHFTFTTDISPNLIPYKENEFPEYDSYLLIYTKDGELNYDVGVKEDFDHDLVMVLSSLQQDVLIHDLLDSLPKMLEFGDEIADAVCDNLDIKEEEVSAYRDAPIVQPANIFRNNHHNHDHD